MHERSDSLEHLTILIFFILDIYRNKEKHQKVESKPKT